jgi:hypothetical protein
LVGSGGFDPQFGWGRVNAWKAVRLVTPAPPPAQAPPARGQGPAFGLHHIKR